MISLRSSCNAHVVWLNRTWNAVPCIFFFFRFLKVLLWFIHTKVVIFEYDLCIKRGITQTSSFFFLTLLFEFFIQPQWNYISFLLMITPKTFSEFDSVIVWVLEKCHWYVFKGKWHLFQPNFLPYLRSMENVIRLIPLDALSRVIYQSR